MQETLNSILDEVRRSWRYRWPGLFVAVLVAAGATLAVLVLPDAFTSIVELSVPQVGDRIPQVIHDTEDSLLSNPDLNAAIREARGSSDSSGLEKRQRADDIIKKQIQIDGTDSAFFRISCKDSTPARAQNLCTLALKTFEGAVAKADLNLQSLAQQLVTQQQALSAAESRLQTYRASHSDFFGQGGISDRLATARTALDKAQSDYLTASNMRDRLLQISKSKNADSDALAAAYEAPSDDTLIRNLYTSFNNLQDLRSRYSDDHPDVIDVKRTIEAIFQQYPPGSTMCTMGGTDQPGAGDFDQEINRLNVDLVAANIWVCRSRAAVSQSQSDVSKLLELSVSSQPIQARLDQLTSERDTIKSRVDGIQKQVESTSSDLTGARSYSIATPPTLPARASGPNRRLLLAGVLTGAIVAGSLFAYFFGLLANTFVRPAEITRTFRLPFYGAVSQISDMRASLERSTQLVSFSLALGALVAAMLLLILFDPLISSARHWIADAAVSVVSGHSKWAG